MSNSIVITVPHRTVGAMWVFVGCQAGPLWQLVELRCRTGIADRAVRTCKRCAGTPAPLECSSL
jgi:hypothetical protein